VFTEWILLCQHTKCIFLLGYDNFPVPFFRKLKRKLRWLNRRYALKRYRKKNVAWYRAGQGKNIIIKHMHNNKEKKEIWR